MLQRKKGKQFAFDRVRLRPIEDIYNSGMQKSTNNGQDSTNNCTIFYDHNLKYHDNLPVQALVSKMENSYPDPKKYIHFPNSWNEKWETEGTTDLEKAKIILYDCNSKDEAEDPEMEALWEVLRASEVEHNLKDVVALATAVQFEVFRNQHSTLKSNWILQRMRFILLKCHANLPHSTQTDGLMSFFFDIAIPRKVEPNKTTQSDSQPDNTIPFVDTMALELTDSMLKVVIVGGGPTGLSAAIKLAELVRCPKRVQIHVYDKRWINRKYGQLVFTAYPEDERRRDQVITLQDLVKDLLSHETKTFLNHGLGSRGAEHIWPESSNLKISKVEDALLKRAQDSVFDGLIHLHGVDIRDELTLMREAGDDFHLLLGTDGANSWIRRTYFTDDAKHEGRSFALGVALERGSKGLPRSQPLNIFLTLCQTRFLLNASGRDGTCYMNMLLTEQEYNDCVRLDGSPADFGSPAYIPKGGVLSPEWTEPADHTFAPYRYQSALWRSISDGLKLFGFNEKEVKNIVRIPINVIAVDTPTKKIELRSPTRLHPHCLVSLAGDSALTHHFWPGRGMNSGIKAAVAWSVQIADLILEGKEGFVGLEPSALNPFLDFMKRLREREHKRRSLVILEECGSPERMLENMNKADKLCERDRKIGPKLCDRLLLIAERFEGRGLPRWPHKTIEGLDSQVLGILAKLKTRTKAEMFHSGPWPTEKMGGDEVIPPHPRIQNRPPSRAEDNTCTTRDEPASLRTVNATARRRGSPACGGDLSTSSCHFMAWFMFATIPFFGSLSLSLELMDNLFLQILFAYLVTWASVAIAKELFR